MDIEHIILRLKSRYPDDVDIRFLADHYFKKQACMMQTVGGEYVAIITSRRSVQAGPGYMVWEDIIAVSDQHTGAQAAILDVERRLSDGRRSRS